MIGVYLFLKYRRSCTWEHFLIQAFQYCKLAVLFLFFLVSPRLCAYYVIYILIVWVVSKNPVYRGSESMITKVTSHDHFYELIGGDLHGKKKESKDLSKMQHTMAIFTSTTSDQCYYTFPMWSKMAHRYSTERLNFI